MSQQPEDQSDGQPATPAKTAETKPETPDAATTPPRGLPKGWPFAGSMGYADYDVPFGDD